VTIGIPTRNRAQTYLRDALASAADQTYPDVDIVVADNCSSDDTAGMVRALADPRIRYVRHARVLSANENFNSCLDHATGDYFLLLHDDDFIDRDFVQVCLEAAGRAGDVGVIRTGTRIVDAGGGLIRELPNRAGGLSTTDFFRSWFAGATTLYMCSTLFNTRRLREMGGFTSPRLVFQDGFAVMPLAARYGRADVEPVKASFRRHAHARTRITTVSDWCDDSLALLDLMGNLTPEGRDAIRREGLFFFAHLNYARAAEAAGWFRRLRGYATVLRKFHYRYPPARVDLHRLIEGTGLHSAARFAKRKLRAQASVG
jgi:glycosyltransferase involved in cell wall biosynthesis